MTTASRFVKTIYRVEYKGIKASIYVDFGGLDIISETHGEITTELYNSIFDSMEQGKSLADAVTLSGAKVVA